MDPHQGGTKVDDGASVVVGFGARLMAIALPGFRFRIR